MKWFRRTVQFVLILAVALTAGVAGEENRQANNAGGYSDVCGVITPETEKWVLEQFGHCQDMKQLLWSLDFFACENFVYTTDSLRLSQRIMQHFDMQSFIQSGFRGVCFDFSCFCKNVTLIWSEARGEQVQVFVCEVRRDLRSGHAYNYFRDSQGNGWYMDVTSDSINWQKGDMEKFWGPKSLGSRSFEEFTDSLYPDGYLYDLYR